MDGITSEALSLLKDYTWPGNVRELKHTVERAVILCQGEVIQAEDIALGGKPPDGESEEEWLSLEEHERRYIQKVLDRTGWVVRGADGAAAILGKHEATLRNRMRKLGIQRP